MRFIKDDEGVVKGPAAHVRKRRHLDQTFFHILRKGIRAHNLVQCIVEGPQIRVNLLLQIARKESELLSRLDGRARQDNAVDFVVFKSGHGHCHGKIRLAGTRRADAEHNHIVADVVHILLLAHGLWLDGLSGDGVADEVGVHREHGLLLVFLHKGERVIDVCDVDFRASCRKLKKRREDALCLAARAFLADDTNLLFPGHDGDTQGLFNLLCELIHLPEDGLLFGNRNAGQCLYHPHLRFGMRRLRIIDDIIANLIGKCHIFSQKVRGPLSRSSVNLTCTFSYEQPPTSSCASRSASHSALSCESPAGCLPSRNFS